MHKLISHTGRVLILGAALLLLPSTTQAQTVYQHQSSTSSFEMNCEGTCKFASESTQNQTQRVEKSNWHGSQHNSDRSHSAPYFHFNQAGHATVTWPQREGTCTIRYTEKYSRWYKYTTTASCNDGQVTIGGLVPGRIYRLQVQPEGQNWMTPQYLTAW